MPGKNSRFQPLCICQRLFDFIVRNLIARGGFKSVALDHPLPQSSSNKVPPDCSKGCLMGSEEEHPLVQAKPSHEALLIMKAEDDADDDHRDQHDWDFEIQVHHKETDDLEHWTPVDNLGSSIQLSDHKDSTIPSPALNEEKEISAVQATSSATVSGLRAQGKDLKEATRSSGTKKLMSSIKDLARGEKSSGKKQGKNKSIISENLTLAVEAEDMETRKPPLRQVRPLFNVAMSINEKSDAFIRSRKAAMRGSFD